MTTLNTMQTAQRLHVSRRTIFNMLRDGRLIAAQSRRSTDRTRRISVESVERYEQALRDAWAAQLARWT